MRFLIVALLIWGGMHTYVWAHVRVHAGLDVRWAAALALAMFVLMASPIMGMSLVRTGHTAVGRPIEAVGMIWSGVFFLFFSVSLVHDCWNALLTLAGHVHPALLVARLTGPRVFAGEAVLVLAISLYSAFEAWQIRTVHVQLTSPKLSAEVPHVRIVQISDVHLGGMVGRRRLAHIAAVVRRTKPEILVSTGDLVDAEMKGVDDMARMLADLPAPLGKYAVTGNHEYYAGIEAALSFTERAGFRMLSEECVRPCAGLTLAGVDDPAARGWHRQSAADGREQEVLGQAHRGDFVVLLKHRPVVDKASVPLMDLQLSGHTHGGQIFPFGLLVAAYYEYGQGLVEVAPGTYLYTSRGTGTWGPPMRFLSPPEVTVIDITRSER
jgi:predicted MPP superfamily phosphohydrolase